MGTVSVTLPSDGQTIDAADYNVPINTIVSTINGGIDSNNITDSTVTPNKLVTGTGTTWVWQSWTPTYTNITVGNGTVSAKYIQIGKTVFFHFQLVCGTTTSLASNTRITPPVTPIARYATSRSPIGGVMADDVGTALYSGVSYFSTTVAEMAIGWYSATASVITGVFPFTEASGDTLDVYGTYEAA